MTFGQLRFQPGAASADPLARAVLQPPFCALSSSMSAKISPRHRKAFLEALAETGNVTLAASQVRVSKDWVYKLRRRDAGFDAACRAAVRKAREALRYAGSPAAQDERFSLVEPPHPPPLRGSSLSPQGRGIVLQRGNGRRVQVKRARPGQWNGETEQSVLAALMACCNVQAAAAHVGKSAFAAYYHRRRDAGFARRWDEAIEIGMCNLQSALIENACHFLNPLDAPPPDHLLDGMSVELAIDIARMNGGKARGLRRWEEEDPSTGSG